MELINDSSVSVSVAKDDSDYSINPFDTWTTTLDNIRDTKKLPFQKKFPKFLEEEKTELEMTFSHLPRTNSHRWPNPLKKLTTRATKFSDDVDF